MGYSLHSLGLQPVRRIVSESEQTRSGRVVTILLLTQDLTVKEHAMFPQAEFHHRHNKYRGHDSICSACLMTVARVEQEPELAYLESVHVCDPVNLYWVGQGKLYALVPDQGVGGPLPSSGDSESCDE